MGRSSRTSWLLVVVGLFMTVGAGRAWAWYDAYTPAYQYYVAPTVQPAVKCDNCSTVVNLPFAFPYYGTTYTQVTISSNGYVLLGSDTANGAKLPVNRALGWAGGTDVPNNMIAALWANWNPAVSGNVYTGSPQSGVFAVEWRDVAHYGDSAGGTCYQTCTGTCYDSCGDPYACSWQCNPYACGAGAKYTFQLKLFADGKFEMHYPKVVSTNAAYDQGVTATVGYQHRQNTVGEGMHYRTDNYLANGQTIGRQPPVGAAFVRAVEPFFGTPRDNIKFNISNTCHFVCAGYDKYGVPIRGPALDKYGNPAYDKYGNPLTTTCAETIPAAVTASAGRSGWVRLAPSCPAGDWFAAWAGAPTVTDYWDATPYPGPYEVIPAGPPAVLYSVGPFYAGDQYLNPRPDRRDVSLVTYVAKTCYANNHTSTANAAAWVTSTDCPLGDNAAAANVAGDPTTARGYCYLNQCRYRSKLDYYYGRSGSAPLGANAHTKAVLIAPGIDALNEDGSAEYYMLLNPSRTGNAANSFATLAEMQKKGIGVLIGNYGDGHRYLSQLITEVSTWTTAAYSFAGSRPVILAGVSMGGQVVKMAVKSTIAAAKVKAVMALDAPLRGANLGSATRSVQTLVACEKYNTDTFWTLFSKPSKDMKTESPTYCRCRDDAPGGGKTWDGISTGGGAGTWPEDSWCTSDNGSWRNAVYAPYATWPAGMRRYAVSSGDATGPSYPNSTTSSKLIDFDYSYFYCSDESWSTTKLDCFPGSGYLHPADASSKENANWNGIPGLGCGSVTVSMNFKPTFIPINSALDVNSNATCYQTCYQQCWQTCDYDKYGNLVVDKYGNLVPNKYGTGAVPCLPYQCNPYQCNPYACALNCPSGAPVVTNLDATGLAGWTGWAANDASWPHCEVSGYLSCKMYNWTLAELGAGTPVACTTSVATTTGTNVPGTQCSVQP